MSVQSEISRLETAKSDLKSAIESKGVSVPKETRLNDYGELVNQIQIGDLSGFTLYEAASIDQSGLPVWGFKKYTLSGRGIEVKEEKQIKYDEAFEGVDVFGVFLFFHDGMSTFTIKSHTKLSVFGENQLSDPQIYNNGDVIKNINDSVKYAIRAYLI